MCSIQVQSINNLLVIAGPSHFSRDQVGFQIAKSEMQRQVILISFACSAFNVTGNDLVTCPDSNGGPNARSVGFFSVTDQSYLYPFSVQFIVVAKYFSGCAQI